MDKRDLAGTFRKRLSTLLARSGTNQSAFAAKVGIDRSAHSQLLYGAAPRGPAGAPLPALLFRRNPAAPRAGGPPVPTAETKPSILPSVCSQISTAVVSTWPSRLATLSNWLAQIAPFGTVFASCSASLPDTFM